jgi:hypothetical protein
LALLVRSFSFSDFLNTPRRNPLCFPVTSVRSVVLHPASSRTVNLARDVTAPTAI